MRSPRRLLGLCLTLAVLLAGCWDGRELDKRAIVLIVGIDRTEEGVRVGLQLARPQAYPGGAGGSGGGGGQDVATVVSREGADVPEALHQLQLAVDRDLFFGHTRVVVLGEEAAREGTWRHLQPLYGDMMLPRTAWLFVARGSSVEILAARPSLDPIPANYLTHFFENRILLQRSVEVTAGGFHRRMVTPGVEPLAVWIAPGQPDQDAPTLLGLAAFQGDRFVGGLGTESSKGWVITQGQSPPGRLPLPCPDRPGSFSVLVARSRTQLLPRLQANSVRAIMAQVHVAGRIEGITCRADFSDPGEVQRFEEALRDKLTDLVEAGFLRAQTELESDIFGVGKATYHYGHRAWPGDERWAELFPELPVELSVTVQLDYSRSYRETAR